MAQVSPVLTSTSVSQWRTTEGELPRFVMLASPSTSATSSVRIASTGRVRISPLS
jgi:hypothetical protein